MRLASTTGDFAGYFETTAESVKCLYDAGFRYIDIMLDGRAANNEFILNDNWEDNAKRLREYAENLGVKFVQAHAPSYGGPKLSETERMEELTRRTIRSIEVCGVLGVENNVVHAAPEVGIGEEEFFIGNKAFYEKLFPAMEKWNVNVLAENSTRVNMRHGYYLISGEDMVKFLRFVDHPLLHACWDTGHANVEGPQYEHLVALGSELRALHIHDNRGERDEHILPWFGTMNLDDLMHGIIDSGYNGYFTFEAGSTLRPARYWLGNRREYPDDTRLLHPQFFMDRKLEELMYEMGEYILKTYDVFEE